MGGVVIDDEELQDLLTRASSLYNNGEYQGAIEAWKEALSVDPQSQKAKEGIRMATLLIGDFESTPTGAWEEAPAAADGAEVAPADQPAEEAEARLELGTARVKQL
ncbi:MAG: tetratricopeptide repeat protein, partial [Acidobacteria bacterium]|nr:tetratricopeptide repeat protein [Acidobacteriota bacterium]